MHLTTNTSSNVNFQIMVEKLLQNPGISLSTLEFQNVKINTIKTSKKYSWAISMCRGIAKLGHARREIEKFPPFELKPIMRAFRNITHRALKCALQSLETWSLCLTSPEKSQSRLWISLTSPSMSRKQKKEWATVLEAEPKCAVTWISQRSLHCCFQEDHSRKKLCLDARI